MNEREVIEALCMVIGTGVVMTLVGLWRTRPRKHRWPGESRK